MCRFRRPRDRGRYLEPASYISLRALHEMTRLRFERVFAACAAHDTELFTYSASTSVRAALLGAGFLVGRGVPTGTKPETTLAMTPAAACSGDVSADHRAAFAARIPRLAQFWSTGLQA